MSYIVIILSGILNMIAGGQFKSKDLLPFHPRYFSSVGFGVLFGLASSSTIIGAICGLTYFLYRFQGWKWFNGQGFLDIGYDSGSKVAEYFMMFFRGLSIAIAPLLAIAFSIEIGLSPVLAGFYMGIGSATAYLLGNAVTRKFKQIDGIALAEAITGLIIGFIFYGVFL